MRSLKIEFKWAIIFSLMMLAWMLMEKLVGLHDKHIELHPIVTNFIVIPAIAIFVFAIRDKRRNYYSGRITYKQAFLTGFFMTVFVTLFTPLIQYITSTVISPEFFANVSAYAVKEKIMTPEEAAQMFNLESYIFQATVGAFVMGIMTSAIVAIFTKSKNI